jgi:hypothetical protein
MLVLGVVVVGIVGLGVVVLVAASSDDTLVLDLDAGDCFDLAIDAGSAEIDKVRVVECDAPHEAELVALGSLNPDGGAARPDDEALFALVDARCASALDGRGDLLERFGILPVAADERSWEPYAGRYVCVAIPYGGGTTVGSALDAAAGSS